MDKRHKILDRFNSSRINIYDMSIIPDNPNTTYKFKNKKSDL